MTFKVHWGGCLIGGPILGSLCEGANFPLPVQGKSFAAELRSALGNTNLWLEGCRSQGFQQSSRRGFRDALKGNVGFL